MKNSCLPTLFILTNFTFKWKICETLFTFFILTKKDIKKLPDFLSIPWICHFHLPTYPHVPKAEIFPLSSLEFVIKNLWNFVYILRILILPWICCWLSFKAFSALTARWFNSSWMALSKLSSPKVELEAGLADFLLFNSFVNCFTFKV